MGNAQPDAAAKFLTVRFGEIEFDPAEVLYFPEGLLGFNPLTNYILLRDPEQDPFLWMQSLQDADLAFVVVDPFLFFPGYEIQVKSQELSAIELEDVSKANVLVILTVPENPMDLTANLRGPLVVNPEKKLAKQLVLIDDRYNTRHLLLRDIPAYLASPPPLSTEVTSSASLATRTPPSADPVAPPASKSGISSREQPREDSSRPRRSIRRRRERP